MVAIHGTALVLKAFVGGTALWTRSGKEIYAPPSLLASLPRGTPLDGELFMGRGKFQTLSRSHHKKLERTYCQQPAPTMSSLEAQLEEVKADRKNAVGGEGVDSQQAAFLCLVVSLKGKHTRRRQ